MLSTSLTASGFIGNDVTITPPKIPTSDYDREYTVGGTNSLYAGVFGMQMLQRLHGAVDDMDVRLGFDAKEEMDKDPFCSAALDALILGATARAAEIEPAPKSAYQSEADEKLATELAEFARRALQYLKENHRDLNLTAFQLGRAAGKIGHVKAERITALQTRGVDKGKRFVQRIKCKNRFNSAFVVDAHNNIVGIAAFTGNYTDFTNPYSKLGLGSYLPYTLLGAGWEILPRDKWVVITNDPQEDDSPLGKSLYRAAYQAYRMKRDIWPMYLKALDNTALPFLVAERPEQQYDVETFPLVNGVPDPTQPKVTMGKAMYQALDTARQAGIAVLPHGSKVAAIHSAQSGDPFLVARNLFNSEITQAILLQNLATSSGKTGAYALGQVHQDVLDLAMRHRRRVICDALDRDFIKPLIQENFPERYWHLAPRVSFGEVELNDFAAWADAYSKLFTSGIGITSQLPQVWAQLGMPQGDVKELEAIIERNKQLLMATSVVTSAPTTAADSTSSTQSSPNGDTSSATADSANSAINGGAAAGKNQLVTNTEYELMKRMTRDSGKARAAQLGGLSR